MGRVSKCVECGGDPFYLDGFGVGPNICGWCKGWMCPTCSKHTACESKIKAHNLRIDLKELSAQRDILNARIQKLEEDLKNG